MLARIHLRIALFVLHFGLQASRFLPRQSPRALVMHTPPRTSIRNRKAQRSPPKEFNMDLKRTLKRLEADSMELYSRKDHANNPREPGHLRITS